MIFIFLIILKNVVTLVMDDHQSFTEKTSVDHKWLSW